MASNDEDGRDIATDRGLSHTCHHALGSDGDGARNPGEGASSSSEQSETPQNAARPSSAATRTVDCGRWRAAAPAQIARRGSPAGRVRAVRRHVRRSTPPFERPIAHAPFPRPHRHRHPHLPPLLDLISYTPTAIRFLLTERIALHNHCLNIVMTRSKRHAEPEADRKRKKAKKDEEDDFEASGGDSDEGIDNDELDALSTANIITTGRRTRGVRIDYTKVEGFDKDDDDDEDEDDEPKAKKSKKPSSSSKGKDKAKPGSSSSAKKAESPPSKPVKKAKRVIVSDEEEEEEEEEAEASGKGEEEEEEEEEED